MNFNALIQQFSKLNPHLELHVDQTGVVHIQLKNDHIIFLRTSLNEETFFLYAQVGELPTTDEDKLPCMQRLLEANLFGDGVGLASLAIHSESNSIILTQTLLAQHTDYAVFEDAYRRFLEYYLYWCEAFKR